MGSKSHTKREIRVLMLGSSGAGKTALSVMFERKYFVKTYEQTTVAESHRREINVDGQQVQMEIIDCGAPSLLPEYTQLIKNADGIVAVYDITSLPSFSKVEPIVRYAQQHKHCPCILVGTKQDKEKERAIRPQDGTALANDLGCPFLEITATSEEAVLGMFRLLAKLVMDDSDPTKKHKRGGFKRLLKFKKRRDDPTAPGVYEEDEDPELQQVPSGDSTFNVRKKESKKEKKGRRKSEKSEYDLYSDKREREKSESDLNSDSSDYEQDVALQVPQLNIRRGSLPLAARTSPFRPLGSEASTLSVGSNPNGHSGGISNTLPFPNQGGFDNSSATNSELNITKSASATIHGFELIHFMTELKELLIQNKDFASLQTHLTQEREKRIALELKVIELEKDLLVYRKKFGDLDLL